MKIIKHFLGCFALFFVQGLQLFKLLQLPRHPPPSPPLPTHRYKMTCEYTWPHHLMSSDREAVEMIVDQHGFKDDVAYGKTKLFVRTPRTLFTLEQERAALIPILVLFLQKVGALSHLGCIHVTALVVSTERVLFQAL